MKTQMKLLEIQREKCITYMRHDNLKKKISI